MKTDPAAHQAYLGRLRGAGVFQHMTYRNHASEFGFALMRQVTATGEDVEDAFLVVSKTHPKLLEQAALALEDYRLALAQYEERQP